MSTAHAADPVRGAALYASTNGAPISCANTSCHGSNPATNKNKIQRGANNGPLISSAISGNTGGMGFLSAYCNATCADDIGAYIANPAAGAGPTATLSPASLTFSGTNVGSSATAQTVTLSNGGASALAISTIGIAGTAATDFSRSGSCAPGGSVAAGSSCTLVIGFTASAAGSRSATLTVAHNASGGSSTLPLTGTGNAVAAPSVSVSTTLIDFGGVTVGTAAAARTVTVTNTGNATLTFGTPVIGGSNASDFARATGTCGATLAPAASCNVAVSFTPAALGTRTGTIQIVGNASNGSPTVTLTGNGQAVPAPVVSLNTASLAFGTATTGTLVQQTITVSNVGNAPLVLTSVTRTGASAFSIASNTCTGTVAAAGSCVVTVAFAPVATGALSGAIVIADSATGSPRTIALSGTGTAAPTAVPQWTDPSPRSFAQTTVGQQSAAQTVTLANVGTASMTIASSSFGGSAPSDFVLGGNCTVGALIAAGQSCSASVRFAPSMAGTRVGVLSVTTNGGATLAVDLTGVGAVAASSSGALAPAALDFGTLGTSGSASLPVMLTNTGTTPLQLQQATLTTPFTLSAAATGGCASLPFTLLPGQSCSWAVSIDAAQASVAAAAGAALAGQMQLLVAAPATTIVATLSAKLPVAAAGTTTNTGAAAAGAGAAAAATPASVADAGATASPLNAGAGGCSAGGDPRVDPTLPLLSTLAALIAWRRARRRDAGLDD